MVPGPQGVQRIDHTNAVAPAVFHAGQSIKFQIYGSGLHHLDIIRFVLDSVSCAGAGAGSHSSFVRDINADPLTLSAGSAGITSDTFTVLHADLGDISFDADAASTVSTLSLTDALLISMQTVPGGTTWWS